MPCYFPQDCWYSNEINPDTGKRRITFNRANARYVYSDEYNCMVPDALSVGCGKCIGCLMERSRSWALRCFLESELHDENCFITLTLNNDNIPPKNRDCVRCELNAIREASYDNDRDWETRRR